MSTGTSENASAHGAEINRSPGELFWARDDGQQARPLRILQGVVAYRRGGVAVGVLGPGHLAVPVPGVAAAGAPAADLVALTETTAVEVDPSNGAISRDDLVSSAAAVLEGADRLGNMSLPQRLAALLLDISELTGQPVIGCRQDILAMAAAARRETVATILSGWRDEDWIQTRYRRCKVLDREALVRIRDKSE